MANSQPAGVTLAGRFTFDVGNLQIGWFSEVSGLSVQIEVEEVAEGGQNQYTHRLLGRMKWPNLVLKRGVTDTDALFKWLTKFSGDGLAGNENRIQSETGSVSVLNSAGKPVRTWEFAGAKPVRWSGPRLAASANEIAMEELEVCHNGFTTK